LLWPIIYYTACNIPKEHKFREIPQSVQGHGFSNLSLFDPLILIMLSGGQKQKCSITLPVATTYVLDYIKLT
jgi:hypothetical protein